MRRLTRSSTQSADEGGFILVWYALLIFVLLGVTAFAVDLGHAYLVAQQEQDAADAAALSAASYLPDNCSNANTHAQNIASLNGFTNGAADTSVTAVNGAVGGSGCDNDLSLSPNEIRVDVRRKVPTWFARVIGIDSVTVHRTSTAEYDPPVALGSPSSFFGNIVGCATCDQPDIWASVSGRANRKSDGNAIYGGWCKGDTDSSDNCPGSGLNSTDRDTNGMLFQIKNPQLEPLNLELYDPGLVDEGANCTAADRYPVCAGDRTDLPTSPATVPVTTTTYTLYPLDNLNNPLGSAPICSATYPGYNSVQAPNPANLTIRSFHKWANFATDAGCPALNGSSYVLQVQSGDDRGLPTQGGVNNFSIAACSACSTSQPTLDPNVSISAITKMALFTNATSSNPKFYLARVPSWAKGQSLTLTFFDIGDVGGPPSVPGALTVSAIDATHGPGGTLVGEFSGCTYSHPASRGNNPTDFINTTTPWATGAKDNDFAKSPGTLTSLGGGCTAEVTTNGATSLSFWNGKWATFKVPIPSDYTCDDRDGTKCWLQIRYAYPATQFHDATTWTASLSGNPVRLTK